MSIRIERRLVDIQPVLPARARGPSPGEDKAKTLCYDSPMDEGRKRTILIAASILVAHKWVQLDGKPSPALDGAIADAITLAERIMQRIDSRSARPNPPDQSMTSSAGYPWKRT